jgi:protein-S-isoprenylcysteine O-methyltransferase Ste14
MLALRSLFFTLLIPGTVVVLIPYLIVSREGVSIHGPWTPQKVVGLGLMAVGAAILIRCIRDFAAKGRGTLAPIDPPKQLVVEGLFRYVRNPMYLGVLVLLVGQAAFFESLALLPYTGLWLAVVHLVVVLYEEPSLRHRFGEPYERYCRSVHRWLPTMPKGRGA